jgi:sugar/nucleoside kinase (ribokinase family)
MSISRRLSRQVLEQLEDARSRLARSKTLVGFDGFVDTILHVVQERESVAKYTRLTAMKDFAAKISAAAGQSTNIELVTQMVKLGGNGPIMANALGRYDTKVTYLGCLGSPNLHPVFAEFARCARVISIAEPGFTDAIEFDDGKLMFGKHESLKDVNWKNLVEHVPEKKLLALFQESALIALVNWTMLTQMTAILQKIATRIAPRLTGEKRWLFFDLADPAKRSREDLLRALKLIAKFEKQFRVIFGLNMRESRRVGEVLGLGAVEETPGSVTRQAALIRAALRIHTVVIHPTQFAAGADATGATHVAGPFTRKPKIATGAGDHFNAGFCIGRLLGLDLAASLQSGVATSGFYVRNARSPRLEDLQKFLRAV